MAKKLTIIAMMIVSISIFGSTAFALTITSPGVVGAVHGQIPQGPGGTSAKELAIAQFILDMATNSTDGNGAGVGSPACNISTDLDCYATSTTDYSGTLTLGVNAQQINGNSVPAGFHYALAKYDNDNGGLVLYYIGGLATILPTASNTLWGSQGTGQYGISHWTAFTSVGVNPNCTPGTCPTVPDGGMTISLLGMAMAGLGLVARRKK